MVMVMVAVTMGNGDGGGGGMVLSMVDGDDGGYFSVSNCDGGTGDGGSGDGDYAINAG